MKVLANDFFRRKSIDNLGYQRQYLSVFLDMLVVNSNEVNKNKKYNNIDMTDLDITNFYEYSKDLSK